MDKIKAGCLAVVGSWYIATPFLVDRYVEYLGYKAELFTNLEEDRRAFVVYKTDGSVLMPETDFEKTLSRSLYIKSFHDPFKSIEHLLKTRKAYYEHLQTEKHKKYKYRFFRKDD